MKRFAHGGIYNFLNSLAAFRFYIVEAMFKSLKKLSFAVLANIKLQSLIGKGIRINQRIFQNLTIF